MSRTSLSSRILRAVRPTAAAIALFAIPSTFLAASAADEPAKSARSLADAVTSDVLLYGDIDVGKAVSEWKSLDAVRLWNDAAVQEFLAPALESMKQNRARLNAMTAMLQAYGMPDTIRGKLSIAVYGLGTSTNNSEFHWFDAAHPPESPTEFGGGPGASTSIEEGGKTTIHATFPDLVLSVDSSGREAFDAAIGRALELAGDVKSTEIDVDGVKVKETRIPIQIELGLEVVVYTGFAGDTWVAALRKDRAADTLKRLGAESIAQDALSQTSGFQRWHGATSRGGEVFQGLIAPKSVAQFASKMAGGQAEFAQAMAAGLGDVETAGLSLAFEGGRLRESVSVVLPKEKRGFLKLFDGAKPATPVASAIPAGANFAFAFDLDVATLVQRAIDALEEIQPGTKAAADQQIAGVQSQFGIDPRGELLDALGSQVVMYASLPKSGIIPDFGGSIAVKDEAKFSALVEKLKGFAGEGSGLKLTDLPIKDRTGAFYLSIPNAPVSPAFCLADGRFHFASSGGALKKALAKTGDASKSIATESKDFQRCLASNVGQAGGDVTGLMYIDLQKGLEFGLGFAPLALGQLPVKLDAALMPDADTLNQYVSGFLVTMRNSNDVLVMDSSSPIGGVFTLGAIGAAAANPMMSPPVTRSAPPQPAPTQPAPVPVTPSAPPGSDQPFVGIMPVPGGSNVGLLVTVAPNGPAADAGIADNDVLLKVDDLKVRSSGDFYAILKGKAIGESIVVEVMRGEEHFTAEITIGRRGDYIQGSGND